MVGLIVKCNEGTVIGLYVLLRDSIFLKWKMNSFHESTLKNFDGTTKKLYFKGILEY